MEAVGDGAMRVPDERTIEQLLDWRPELGVISVYVGIDPAERSEPWRVALRAQLAELVDAEADRHGRRPALAATVERILRHFPEHGPPSGRCQIGFCEVARKNATDFWMGVQMTRDETEVCDGERPHLTPLLELLDEGAPVGVVAISAERVHLYESSLGDLSDIQEWEAVLFMPDWRERKSQSSPDPARVHGA